MLDFPEGRTYEIAPDTNVVIRPSDVVLALKNPTSEGAPQRTETQRFVIDRYDRLFVLVSQLQVAVRAGLVRKGDVQFPLSWYAEKRLCRHKQLLLNYMKENAAPETIDFFASLVARVDVGSPGLLRMVKKRHRQGAQKCQRAHKSGNGSRGRSGRPFRSPSAVDLPPCTSRGPQGYDEGSPPVFVFQQN